MQSKRFYKSKVSRIYLETSINASAKTCFDLSRSIDLHISSMSKSKERVVEGRSHGLIQKGEFVTWQAKHFFVEQRLSTKITEMEEPKYFVDEMISGAFKSLWHKHEFVKAGSSTVLIDDFKYVVPYGFLGRLFDWLVLRKYMRNLLVERNLAIKRMAELPTSS